MCLVLDHHRQGFRAVVQLVTAPRVVTGGFQQRRWQDISAKLNKDHFVSGPQPCTSSKVERRLVGSRARVLSRGTPCFTGFCWKTALPWFINPLITHEKFCSKTTAILPLGEEVLKGFVGWFGSCTVQKQSSCSSLYVSGPGAQKWLWSSAGD